MRRVVTLALILTFSPKEKEQPLTIFHFTDDRPTNAAAGFSKGRRTILLLLGEKAGMRESVKHFSTRLKAAVNAPHSRRFARFADARQARSVWSARGFSTAFGWGEEFDANVSRRQGAGKSPSGLAYL